MNCNCNKKEFVDIGCMPVESYDNLDSILGLDDEGNLILSSKPENIESVVYTDDTITGDGSESNPLGVDIDYLNDNLDFLTGVHTDDTLSGNGSVDSPLSVNLDNLDVYTKDEVDELISDIQTNIITDDTLLGSGSETDPLRVNTDIISSTIKSDEVTISGTGSETEPVTAISPVIQTLDTTLGYNINNNTTNVIDEGSGYSLGNYISINNVQGTVTGIRDIKREYSTSQFDFDITSDTKVTINDNGDILFNKTGTSVIIFNKNNNTFSALGSGNTANVFGAKETFIRYSNSNITAGSTNLPGFNKFYKNASGVWTSNFIILPITTPKTVTLYIRNFTPFGTNSNGDELILIYLSSIDAGNTKKYIIYNNTTETAEGEYDNPINSTVLGCLIQTIGDTTYCLYQDLTSSVFRFRKSNSNIGIFTAPDIATYQVPGVNTNSIIKSIAVDSNNPNNIDILFYRYNGSQYVNGIIRTLNGGINWTQLFTGVPPESGQNSTLIYDGSKFILLFGNQIYYSKGGGINALYLNYSNPIDILTYNNTSNQGFYIADNSIHYIDKRSGFVTNVNFDESVLHTENPAGIFTDTFQNGDDKVSVELNTEEIIQEVDTNNPLNKVEEPIAAKSYVDNILYPDSENNKIYDFRGEYKTQIPTKQYVDDLVNTSIIIKPTGSGNYKWIDLDIALTSGNRVIDTSLYGSVFLYEIDLILDNGENIVSTVSFQINSSGYINNINFNCNSSYFHKIWYLDGYEQSNVCTTSFNGKLQLVFNVSSSGIFNINVWKDNQIDKRNISIESNNTVPSSNIYLRVISDAPYDQVVTLQEYVDTVRLDYNNGGYGTEDNTRVIYYQSVAAVEGVTYNNRLDGVIFGSINVSSYFWDNTLTLPCINGYLPYSLKIFKREEDSDPVIIGDFDIQSRLCGNTDVVTFEPYVWFEGSTNIWGEDPNAELTLYIGFKVIIHNDVNNPIINEIMFNATKPNKYDYYNLNKVYDSLNYWDNYDEFTTYPIIGKQTPSIESLQTQINLLQQQLQNYLPLAGGQMNQNATIDMNGGTIINGTIQSN